MKSNKTLRILFCLMIFFGHVLADTDSLIVDTQFGPVQGEKSGAVYRFLGIPFAKPPVGELRWRAPQNPEYWAGVLNANEFPPECPQKAFEAGVPDSLTEIIGDEDCLYLNVWTPGIEDSSLPVMVYIHGGGNQMGSTSKAQDGALIYDGALLAERGDVVVVTIQYRLGALGFLVHPGLPEESENSVSGNYALLDQILALKWVQNNIAGFGGDPEKVMLFGESGGAVDVSLLLTSPLAAGLFQRALIQSGAAVAKDYSEAQTQGTEYAEKRGCGDGSPQEQITCLRSLPADSFVVDLTHPFEGGTVSQTWGGVVDGWVLPMDPLEALESGNFNHVPLVVGSNADETAITAPATITPEMTRAYFRLAVPKQFYDRLLELYPPGTTNRQAREAFIQATTDAQFTANARRIARGVAQNQDEPVWRYFFSHTLSGLSGLYGAYHGLELFFVFQTIDSTTYARDGKITNDDRSVATMMGQYWSRFAETGNPNQYDLTEWQEYNSVTDAYLDINVSAFRGTDLRTEKCDFWDQVMNVSTNINKTDGSKISENFTFVQNYPNPFNPTTRIEYILEKTNHVKLTVYNIAGQKIRTLINESQSSGKHSIVWDGRDDAGHLVRSGCYICHLRAGNQCMSIKMLYLK